MKSPHEIWFWLSYFIGVIVTLAIGLNGESQKDYDYQATVLVVATLWPVFMAIYPLAWFVSWLSIKIFLVKKEKKC